MRTPEEDGPLTPEQHAEFLDHPLRGECLFETEQHTRSYKNILETLVPGDFTFPRFKQLHDESLRYEHLLRRFTEHGVAEVIDLTEEFNQATL